MINTEIMASESIKEDLRDGRVPSCIFWTCEEVAKWIEDLGFPDYKDCFLLNGIHGRKLIIMEASKLPHIGIYDFEHIKKICKSIRDMLTIESPYWNRSISQPPKEYLGMYLEKKSVSGEHSDELCYPIFLRDYQDAKWKPPLSNHCLLLPHDSAGMNDSSLPYY